MVQACEGASPEDGRANGACGFFIRDTHVAATRVFFDGHFRDDGDSHTGADHAENAAKLATLENDLWVEAGTVARGNGGVAEAVAVAQE